MKFSIMDFFSKCYQIPSFLRLWSHLLKKSLEENFIFLCNDTVDITYVCLYAYISDFVSRSLSNILCDTTQKMRFSIKDSFSKCDQIRKKLWIWSHLLKKSLMGNFIFCAVWSLSAKIFSRKSFIINGWQGRKYVSM